MTIGSLQFLPAPSGTSRRLVAAAIVGVLFLGASRPGPSARAAVDGPLDLAEPPTGELWVQNISAIDPQTSVTARFFAPGGPWDFSPVLLASPPRSTDLLRVGVVAATLPDGQLAAAVGPNTPFPSAAVARNDWPASGAAVSYGAAEADARVVIPWVLRRFGAESSSSRVRIQNTRPDQAVEVTVALTALGSDRATLTLKRNIPAGDATELDLAGDGDLSALPDGFAGSLAAEAASGGQIAAVATTALETSDQAAYAAVGARPAALGSRLVAPRVARAMSETRGDGSAVTLDSFIAVMNADTVPAAVTLSYRGSEVPDNACAGTSYVHGGAPTVIPAGGAAVFAQGDLLAGTAVGDSGLPDGCLAAAVIASDGALLAAHVVELEDAGRRAAAYEAVAAAVAERRAYLPLFRRGFHDLSSGIQVANAGARTTLASLKAVLTADGRTVTVDRSVSLAPGASVYWDAAALAEIPLGAIGAAVVSGSLVDVPLVALGRETGDDGKTDNTMFSGFREPLFIDQPAPQPDIYPPVFAPSLWNAGVYDLGLVVTGTTAAEQQRIKTTLNDMVFAYGRGTGLKIAVSVQPFMRGKVPFQDWLDEQIDQGFTDLDIRARSWVVALNYNAVVRLGRAGDLVPLDAGVFPGQGDFLDDAWDLNLLAAGEAPIALPWLRLGCSPNYRNLALLAPSRNRDHGFALMDYLSRPEQQRENYQPQGAGHSQIGYPTLKALYTQFGIQCPELPTVLRTAPEQVDEVVDSAAADAERLAAAFASLDVLTHNDGANPAKAVGAESTTRMVVAQPMINHLEPEELDRRLRSAAGLVVGSISLRVLPTATPTATDTATATPTASNTPTSTATATATDTATPPATDTATATASATSSPRPTATATPGPSPTSDGRPSPTATRPASPPPPSPTATASATPTPTKSAAPRILLPYLARGHDRAAPAILARPEKPDPRLAAADPASASRLDAGETAYAIVWRKLPDASIKMELVAESGQVVTDPAALGIAVPPVAPRYQGGGEPEAWVQRGSVIVCINVDQYKGCVTVQD